MEKTKIAAIVVTYNRKKMLQDCLRGIIKSDRSLDRIFVIDNGSTDGTREMVNEVYGSNEKIEYLRQKNSGSAGGFYTGAKAAYEWGADWIWFLDDDVMPEPTCLEKMLKYQHVSHCIHPSKRDIHNIEFMWESIFDPSTGRMSFLENISFKNGKDFTFVNIGCFEGMLMHRDVVEKIGFPDPRFFIVADDALYGFLASLYTNVIFIKDATIVKLVSFNFQITPQFLYYAIRNQFIIKEYLKKLGLFKKLFYIYFSLFVVYALTKHTIRIGSIRTPYYVIKGIIDGIRGKFYKLG